MMTTLGREDKLRLEDLHYEEDIGGYCRGESPPVRASSMEQEKRIRREIANSNERRRMQSINAGFQSLRTLLPHHEGEKLSKAAILQQTAEYIYQLEQEKTRLLSQNCHLKRLLNQQEGESPGPNKKRKADGRLVGPSQSPDSGLGTPGPLLMPPCDADMDLEAGEAARNELIEVRNQLDRERRLRMMLEEQVRSLEAQLYPERIREITQKVQMQYQQREELDTDCPALLSAMRRESSSEALVSAVVPSIPNLPNLPNLPSLPTTLQVVAASSLPVAHTETVIATSALVAAAEDRLPSILEAAIMAEPKVEVERLPSPGSPSAPGQGQGHEAGSDPRSLSQARVYLASTSRQNLETIVEAIRHLEGDNLFGEAGTTNGAATSNTASTAAAAAIARDSHDSDDESPEPQQDVPLALTKHSSSSQDKPSQHLLKVKMNQYLQFHGQATPGSSSPSSTPASNPSPSAPSQTSSSSQPPRPGVIVVKQHT